MIESIANHPDNSDLAGLRGLLIEREALIAAQDAELRNRDLLIEKLKHQLAGLQRHRFGTRAENLDQLALRLEDEEITQAVASGAHVRPLGPAEPADDRLSKAKRQPKRRPLPNHLPRHETVLSPGVACTACGGTLKRLGDDVTEELEYIPGHFVVNRIVRPRLACSGCEQIVQAELPSRPIERGRPGPGLLSHLLVGKYADHLPLYRQAQMFARDGVDLERSTLADWVGRSTALLEPLAEAIGRHVLGAQAIFADDTPVKMLAPGSGKTKTARLWTYVRDERPWNGPAQPAAYYRFSTDRKAQRPADHLDDFTGWMHADGYAGFEALYRAGKIQEVACMAHVRRKFVDVHQSQGSAIAEQAIKRIAELYAIEKEIRGLPPDQRVRVRQTRASPVFDDLEAWLKTALTRLSAKTPLAGAIRYGIKRMKRLRPYLQHGFLEIDNNTAERGIRGIALGRKNWLFVGSKGGGHAAAIAYTLIETAKLNGVDPRAWLTDILGRIADHKITRLDELMPWHFAPNSQA